jgi:hypothetical protein
MKRPCARAGFSERANDEIRDRSDRLVRVREQTALAVLVAAMLSAGAAHVARSDAGLSAADAADALCCDERLAAIAAATRLCSDGPLTADAGGEVARASDAPAARAAAALPRAARATGSPALHTATPARPLHHHLHHGALAAHHPGRRPTPELRAHRQALRPAGGAPVPPAPARESHPRAALPVLVRPAHHPTWGGGSRLACALTASSWTLSVNATTIARDEGAHVPDAGHEANEARGPPRTERIAPIPPTFARSLPCLPRARSPRSTSDPTLEARPAPEPDLGVSGAPRALRAPAPALMAAAAPARGPMRGPAFPFVVPALPLGRADVRRMESAAACHSWLSSGGVPCSARI